MNQQKINKEKERKIDYIASWIAYKLRKASFNVTKKFVYEYEGVTRVIDVLAEATPFPEASIRVGFKIHTGNILTVDDIERYIAWSEELPIDKLVIVAIGDVNVSAYELAKKHKIDIIKPSEELKIIPESIKAILSTYEELYIKPLIDLNHVLKVMKEKVEKHSLFRKRKKLTEIGLVYVPLICLYGEIAEKYVETEELLLKNIIASFDGIEGYPVVKKNTTFFLDESLGSFSELTDEALIVLRNLSEYGALSFSELASHLGVVHEKLKDIVETLSTKMLIDLYGDLVEIRYTLFDYFADPKKVAEKFNAEICRGTPSEDKGKIVLPIKVFINRFIELIEALNGKITSLNIIYYPFYVGVISADEKAIKLLIIDGLDGHENSSFCLPLSSIEIVETIKSQSIKVKH